MSQRKFIVGAGRQKRDGWETIDADESTRPDIVATLPPIPECCRGAAAIEMIHVLEHFYPWDADAIVRQAFEMLAPGGQLIVECPNLRSAIDALSGASGKCKRRWGMWVLYGDPSHRNPLFGHRWGWTPETLGDLFLSAGFNITHERARFHVPGRDFRIVGQKK